MSERKEENESIDFPCFSSSLKPSSNSGLTLNIFGEIVPAQKYIEKKQRILSKQFEDIHEQALDSKIFSTYFSLKCSNC